MSSQARHIVCPRCETVNRIAADRPAREAKCGRCHQPLFTGSPAAVDGTRLEKHVKSNDIPVVVDFWAPWCGPCRVMAPAYAQVAAEIEPNVRMLKLNTEDDPATAECYSIRGIPTLMLFRNGQRVAQTSGAMDARSLRSWIGAHTQ